MIIAATFLSLLLAGGATSAPAAGLLCTAEQVRNESTGQLLPAGQPFAHSRDQLREDGDFYVRHEMIADEHGPTEIEHRIDRRTGTFEAVAMRTVHEVGEQYLVRTTGTCKPIGHTPLARPSRY
jgi:hypothetical protein